MKQQVDGQQEGTVDLSQDPWMPAGASSSQTGAFPETDDQCFKVLRVVVLKRRSEAFSPCGRCVSPPASYCEATDSREKATVLGFFSSPFINVTK